MPDVAIGTGQAVIYGTARILSAGVHEVAPQDVLVFIQLPLTRRLPLPNIRAKSLRLGGQSPVLARSFPVAQTVMAVRVILEMPNLGCRYWLKENQ